MLASECHFEVTFGSLWGHFGATLGPLWLYGGDFGSLWDHYVMIVESLWVYEGLFSKNTYLPLQISMILSRSEVCKLMFGITVKPQSHAKPFSGSRSEFAFLGEASFFDRMSLLTRACCALLTACLVGNAAASCEAIEKISLQLKWLVQAQFMGYMAGREIGGWQGNSYCTLAGVASGYNKALTVLRRPL